MFALNIFFVVDCRFVGLGYLFIGPSGFLCQGNWVSLLDRVGRYLSLAISCDFAVRFVVLMSSCERVQRRLVHERLVLRLAFVPEGLDGSIAEMCLVGGGTVGIFGGVVKECFCILGVAAKAIHGGSWVPAGLIVEHLLSNKINKVPATDTYIAVQNHPHKLNHRPFGKSSEKYFSEEGSLSIIAMKIAGQFKRKLYQITPAP